MRYKYLPVIARISSESDLQLFQEPVHAGQEGLGSACFRLDRRDAFEDNYPVRQVGRHYEIVLNYETSFLGVHNEPGTR